MFQVVHLLQMVRRQSLPRVRQSNCSPFLAAFFVTAVFLARFCQPLQAAQPARPNIVVILTDDQGWGDLSVHGNTNLSTPHIDSLAKDGALFERFFVCPVCSPTRAEFLTGRYHPRGGVHSTSTGGERLDLDESTVAEAFQKAGYATGAFGKWHNGMQAPYHPNSRGFDEYYGFCSGHWGEYFNPLLEHNGKLVQGEGYIIDDLTNKAIAFIEEHRKQPFFCYLPYNTPHSPMQVPDEYYERFRDKELKMRHRDPARENSPHLRAALAMCENIDWNVGRILKTLDRHKLTENTIVIYFSDNGPNGYRWNGGMKGRKGSTDEGGVRVPFLIRWPAKIPAGLKVPRIAAAIDLLPTLTDMARIPRVGKKPLDGVSLSPLLLKSQNTNSRDWPDRMIFSHWRGRVSVRTQRFRLDQNGQLYDLQQDPGQSRDVSQQHAEVTTKLRQAVAQWKAELLPGLTDDDRPFPIGFSAETHLPARDGRPHGSIKRSSKAPNCSYMTNWTKTDDKVTWDIEAASDGRYEFTVHYTCPKADVGSVVELSSGDVSTRAQVTTPHDPPLRGKDRDRTPNRGTESYVKDFRPLKLGILNLKAGRQTLTLRAVSIPGSQVMDVRYLIVNKLAD